MAELRPELAAEVLAACQAGAAEAAAALTRTFDRKITLEVGAAATWADAPRLGACQGPGLAVVLGSGAAATVVAIPESSGLLPAWCAEPDATGRSKLNALAQELGMLLVPESAMPDDFRAGMVSDLAAALERGGATAAAGLITLTLAGEGAAGGTAALVWPVADKGAILEPAKPPGAAAGAPPTAASRLPKHVPAGVSVDALPPYAKSLLRIKVPVQVVLAAKKQQVGRIIELGPGSIIHFDKSCDEMLDLCVCGHRVAQGETVKVGDKFGIRLTSLTLPEERFKPARPE